MKICNFNKGRGGKDLTFSVIEAGVNMDAKRKAKYESAQRLVNIGNIMCCCSNAIQLVFCLDIRKIQYWF